MIAQKHCANKMTNVYRIFPVLWNDGICKNAQTVYAIDRGSSSLSSVCASRVKEDPAYYWNASHFQRLTLPASCGGGQNESVTWPTLPAWLSYALSQGYTMNIDYSTLKPYSDIYITGP
jgi:hypothetical protein